MLKQFEEITEKKVTKRSVYRLLHHNSNISKNEIHQKLGGSLSNISRHLMDLEKEGLIKHHKGSGRTPGNYRIQKASGYAVGGYINGEVYGIGLCDVGGNVLEVEERFFTSGTTPGEIAIFFRDKRDSFLSRRPLAKDNYLGAGFGIVGPLRRTGGILMHPDLIPSWQIVPIKDYLEEEFKEQVALVPWAECALIGELFFGTIKPQSTSMLLWIDRGIGTAISNNGQMNLDKPEQSSAIGHQVVNFKGPVCTCRKKGCLNAYGTIDSLLHNFQPLTQESDKILVSFEKEYRKNPWKISPQLELIKKYMDNSDFTNHSNKQFKNVEDAFLAAISNYLYLFRPDNLIFTGRTSIKFQNLFSSIVNKTCGESDKHIRIQTNTIFTSLTREKMVQGAAALVFNKYLGFIK
jgi:predicted NBD/HSP70 family sugar kinase